MKGSFAQKELRVGLVMAVLGAVFFSTKPILIKLVYAYSIDSITLLTYRMLFSVPVYVLIGVWLLSTKHRSLPFVAVIQTILLGIVGYYGAALFDLYGLQLISTQLGRMILFTYPTLVTLFGWLLFSIPIAKHTFTALFVSYIGVSLIFIQDMHNYGNDVLIGAGWVMLSAICFAFFLLLSKRLIEQLGSRLFTCIAMTASGGFVFLHYSIEKNLFSGGVMPSIPPTDALLLIFAIAIISTVIPTFLIAAAIATHRAFSNQYFG